MSVTPGNHMIRTSTGKYLTLVSPTGILTAMPPTGASNQVWDFQPCGASYAMLNIGYPMGAYAYSTGQETAPVTGNSLPTEWTVIPIGNGVYSIQYGQDISKAYYVGPNDQVSLAPTQLMNPMQQLSIE